jgi:hypothetical protein
MPLYELSEDQMLRIEQTTFDTVQVKEREDLQRLLRDQIEIVVAGGLVLAEEFSDWEGAKRSIDLLVLDQDGNLVVVELKRTEDGGHMELQAIRYAAMVSTMTFDQAVEAHRQYLMKRNGQADPQQAILDHLGWESPQEDNFAQNVRIVLVSADFSKEITTAVLWLNERDLDIRCVRMVPYRHKETTLLDVQQVIPLPEALEYQVRVKEKATQERAAKLAQGGNAERNLRFWSGLLEKANARNSLHQSISPSTGNWIAVQVHGGLKYSYVHAFGKGRIDLYFDKPIQADNKAAFDFLQDLKSEIEQNFSGELVWQRLDDKTASRIYAPVDVGNLKDESTWDEMQKAMVETMEQLEATFRPYLEEHFTGSRHAH